MSTEKKFMRRMGKCTWQDYKMHMARLQNAHGKITKCIWRDYKANDDILSEIKINPVVKKIQNYINRYHMIGEWTETTCITLNWGPPGVHFRALTIFSLYK